MSEKKIKSAEEIINDLGMPDGSIGPDINNNYIDSFSKETVIKIAEAYHAQFAPVGEDVEQAAEKWVRTWPIFKEDDLKTIGIDGFINGAQWQSSQQSSNSVSKESLHTQQSSGKVQPIEVTVNVVGIPMQIDSTKRIALDAVPDLVSEYFVVLHKEHQGHPCVEVQNFTNSDTRLSLFKVDDKTKGVAIETRTELNHLEFIFASLHTQQDKSGFINYITEQRASFSRNISEDWLSLSIDVRVQIENLLIAYDQMAEKLK